MKGKIFNYLAKMTILHAKYGSSLAYLTSLREVSILDSTQYHEGDDDPVYKIRVDLEPSFIALGENHLAIGRNNRVLFYDLATAKLIDEQVIKEVGIISHEIRTMLVPLKQYNLIKILSLFFRIQR